MEFTTKGAKATKGNRGLFFAVFVGFVVAVRFNGCKAGHFVRRRGCP